MIKGLGRSAVAHVGHRRVCVLLLQARLGLTQLAHDLSTLCIRQRGALQAVLEGLYRLLGAELLLGHVQDGHAVSPVSLPVLGVGLGRHKRVMARRNVPCHGHVGGTSIAQNHVVRWKIGGFQKFNNFLQTKHRKLIMS